MKCWLKWIGMSLALIMIASLAYSDEPQTTHTKLPTETHQDIVQSKEDKNQLKPADQPPYFPIDEPEEEDYGESRFWDEFINMLFTLGLLLALLFGASWLMRRLTSSRVQYANVTSQIKILEQRNLSPKTALYLVEIGDQHVVIADSQTGVAKILEVKKSPGSESLSEQPNHFERQKNKEM